MIEMSLLAWWLVVLETMQICLEYPWEHAEAYICKAFNTACESGNKDTSAGNLEKVTKERPALECYVWCPFIHPWRGQTGLDAMCQSKFKQTLVGVLSSTCTYFLCQDGRRCLPLNLLAHFASLVPCVATKTLVVVNRTQVPHKWHCYD